MTQNDRQLLLKDLCARLPYVVKVELDEKFKFNKGTHTLVKELLDLYCVEGIKPYLRPMSSMSEEEIIELNNIPSTKNYTIIKDDLPWDIANYKQIDWLNAHHFDYCGLIEKGLAIAVTEKNNPYKK